ncbi:hypothetical protein [Paenibacillus sonchi]|uniref:hypothetical protein n=1 Tax=Paenibacillus sonchi TaxID=373687 RepID=UPI0002E76D44|nr:hypothetical protein [Paenibacillus sonchi]
MYACGILPVFSHTLLLRRGQVVQSGLTSEILTAGVLSDFFESEVIVERHVDRVYVRAAQN